MIDFTTIEYLKTGNTRQRQAYRVLSDIGIFEKLSAFSPLLTGTIPIEIDVPSSDLDIICECENHMAFAGILEQEFGNEDQFKLKTSHWGGLPTIVASFEVGEFEIEVFGQPVPTQEQNAFRHMMIEYYLLQKRGPDFKAEIIELKRKGMKTEPAFAQLLGLPGNPYEALLGVDI